MKNWKKLDAGEYESDDGRFHIIKAYDRIYGDHWQLRDRQEPDYHKSLYHERTLKECRAMAITLEREAGGMPEEHI